jgi:hypothetical protein
MTSEQPSNAPLSYDELLKENQALRRQLETLRTQEPYTWGLFAEAGRKLQVYSASIKAAVSSLLNYDIFWDHANEHEFLETIDSSVNQVSEMIAMLTLAFRAEANSLVLSRDPHLLQEILSISQINATRKYPGLRLAISFPPDGKPVLVDYDYLNKVLQLFYEVFYARNPAGEMRVVAREHEHGWFLDFIGADASSLQIIDAMYRCRTQPATGEHLAPENILRLHLVCEILHLQQISVEILEDREMGPVLRLDVPDFTPK